MSDKEEIVFCKGGGCTAKLGPGILARVLEKIPKTRDENLMIGYDSSDDAAVSSDSFPLHKGDKSD